MNIKSVVVCLVGFVASVLSVSAFAQLSPEKEFGLKMDLQMRESRSQYKPVTNEEFSYELMRPLYDVDKREIYTQKRTCFQPGVIIEVQNGKIIYASKGLIPTKKIPCPKLPFE